MRYNYYEENLIEGPPYQVYSRSKSACIPLTDTKQSHMNYLSSLSQLLFDLDLEVIDLDETVVHNGIRAINEALVQAKNRTYQLGYTFGNVFNYVMYNVDDTDQFMLDTVARGYLLDNAGGIYTRSTGERVTIADMPDMHLYRAFRRKLIDKFGLTEEYFRIIDTARDMTFMFLLMSLITTSTLIDLNQFDSEMRDLLDEIIDRSDENLKDIWQC